MTTRPLTVPEAAERLGFCAKTVYRLVHRRELTAIRRPGCSIRIPQQAIVEFEERHLCPAQPEPPSSPGSSPEKAGETGTSNGSHSVPNNLAASARASRTKAKASRRSKLVSS